MNQERKYNIKIKVIIFKTKIINNKEKLMHRIIIVTIKKMDLKVMFSILPVLMTSLIL